MTKFRTLEPDDYNFVLSSWARSFRGSRWAGNVPNHRQPGVVKDEIDSLLSRGAVITLAVFEDDSTYIIGWCCHELSKGGVSVIHYVFVKEDDRKSGMATELLSRAGNGKQRIHTHRTSDCRYLRGLGDYVPAVSRRKELEPLNVKAKNRKRKISHIEDSERNSDGADVEREDLPENENGSIEQRT